MFGAIVTFALLKQGGTAFMNTQLKTLKNLVVFFLRFLLPSEGSILK